MRASVCVLMQTESTQFNLNWTWNFEDMAFVWTPHTHVTRLSILDHNHMISKSISVSEWLCAFVVAGVLLSGVTQFSSIDVERNQINFVVAQLIIGRHWTGTSRTDVENWTNLWWKSKWPHSSDIFWCRCARVHSLFTHKNEWLHDVKLFQWFVSIYFLSSLVQMLLLAIYFPLVLIWTLIKFAQIFSSLCRALPHSLSFLHFLPQNYIGIIITWT